MRNRIYVVQRRMTHYRVAFFEALRREMAGRNHDLVLAYGQGTKEEQQKGDSGEVSWATPLKTWYGLFGHVCWLAQPPHLDKADMVVLTAENKLISNLPVQYLNTRTRVGLWGHGANLQGAPESMRENFKRIVARQADWWFGYTSLSIPLIERAGFPRDRITSLNNSIDTEELASMRWNVGTETVQALREELGLKGKRIGVFLGSLYAEKRIDFLLEAARAIHRKNQSFELLIIGSGVQRPAVEAFCQSHSWVRHLGVLKGQDKANALALARVILNPGMVGLSLLDSFVCQLPLVTTDGAMHSPEIAYLENGVNGLITDNSISAYSDAVNDILVDDDLFHRLSSGCRRSALHYTIERMAHNFADGVEQCLARPPYRGARC
jgi:L-malate glycosyltransferase